MTNNNNTTKGTHMDITIVTSDPEAINSDEIVAAIEALNYFVASITVVGRYEG